MPMWIIVTWTNMHGGDLLTAEQRAEEARVSALIDLLGMEKVRGCR